jgi:hypothetical protein
MADEKTYQVTGFGDVIKTIRGKAFRFGEAREKDGTVIEEGEDLTVKLAAIWCLETSSDKETPFIQRYRRVNIAKKIERSEDGPVSLTLKEIKEVKLCAALAWNDRIMGVLWNRFDPDGMVEFDEKEAIEKKKPEKKE